ncbi:hypothetical protein [Candidatus Odyssella thessalonicensis]|uniref:hypothetical protein n=1 Tax=Candidatus Odyssella thessalonicensis TaxID=84647 RepID=UPI000225ACE2|nr:hypothetical protein [Candidatus Odyssella thessalonicensis]
MRKVMVILVLAGSSLADSGSQVDRIPYAKPVVRISLPRVLEVMGRLQEIERQNEAPRTLLLYTLDDRLEKLMHHLKGLIHAYEQEEKVRLDITAIEEDTPDYTDDFIEKMNQKVGHNE